jgi:hypothetical protein
MKPLMSFQSVESIKSFLASTDGTTKGFLFRVNTDVNSQRITCQECFSTTFLITDERQVSCVGLSMGLQVSCRWISSITWTKITTESFELPPISFVVPGFNSNCCMSRILGKHVFVCSRINVHFDLIFRNVVFDVSVSKEWKADGQILLILHREIRHCFAHCFCADSRETKVLVAKIFWSTRFKFGVAWNISTTSGRFHRNKHTSNRTRWDTLILTPNLVVRRRQSSEWRKTHRISKSNLTCLESGNYFHLQRWTLLPKKILQSFHFQR